jgi:hypothetical protein
MRTGVVIMLWSRVSRLASRVSRLASLIVCAVLIAPGSARAYDDWDNFTEIANEGGGDLPLGTAIRSWGPADTIFVFSEEVALGNPNETNAAIRRYTCSNNDVCTTPTLNTTYAVGDNLFGDEAFNAALAIHRASSTDPIELLIALKQEYREDCDGDNLTAEDGDSDDFPAELGSYIYSTTSIPPLNFLSAIELDGVNECNGRGVITARRGAGAWHVCFTDQPDGVTDRIACDNSSGSLTLEWPNVEILDTAPSGPEEHPSFDFKDGDRVVAASNRPGASTDKLRIHFPDGTAPPNEDVVEHSYLADGVSFPDVGTTAVTGGGHVTHIVWEESAGDLLRHARCPQTDDCLDAGDWTLTTIYDSDAGALSHPHLALDGGKQFVLFEKDVESGAGLKSRVMLTERCGTGSWSTPEFIRTPDDGETSNEDQLVSLSRPAIALNREEHIVHVVFVESNADDSTSELWWYRREYDPCE